MGTTYTVTIDLDDADTLEFLKGKSLRVYKGVNTNETGGLPVVWFSQNKFSGSVRFSWVEQYGGFVRDGGEVKDGFNISDVSAKPMQLGGLLTASDDGVAQVTNDGTPGAITITNDGKRDWMCGMGQVVNGALSPICAFDLGGVGESVIMEPYEKLVLVFESSQQIDTGTVVAEAVSPSITIELDGQNTSRSVSFRKDTSWTGNNEEWVTPNKRNLKLADVLIVPGSGG